jgi:hypothetical protein
MVDVVFHVPEFVELPTAFVSNAVADVHPAATEAASVARSFSRFVLIAIESPADL